MTTDAKAAFGTELRKGGIGGVVIAELTNIGGVPLDSDEIDVTNHQSPHKFEEVIQGIKRTGALPLEGNFIPGDTAGQIALATDYFAGTVDDYAVVFPEEMAAAWTFRAWVKSPPVTEAPHDGKIPFTASLRVTGKPSLDITYSDGLTAPFFAISESAEIVPDPAGDVYDYVATVLTGVESVTVTPTAVAGVIKVNGNIVATGSPSSAIVLGGAGSVTNITIEVKEANKIARVYKIALARA